ncbi:hypothetical protein GXP67_06025 [Rhodocytophaga rosea]|uniref:Uncharacterized protein n=1 Tax=Rhodocytophaga rosea TaxID=2704465 RepID=A0A6C0GE53_9BACT|nr:hypothetical protein GXP67_06025 [Rhodocytophaga rosea]
MQDIQVGRNLLPRSSLLSGESMINEECFQV